MTGEPGATAGAAPGATVRPLPASEAPREALHAAGLEASAWSAGPAATFAPHRHRRPKRLFVVDGAIRFIGAFGRVDLARGQGIRIEAGTEHAAVAGAAGVRCVEGFE